MSDLNIAYLEGNESFSPSLRQGAIEANLTCKVYSDLESLYLDLEQDLSPNFYVLDCNPFSENSRSKGELEKLLRKILSKDKSAKILTHSGRYDVSSIINEIKDEFKVSINYLREVSTLDVYDIPFYIKSKLEETDLLVPCRH